MSIESFIFQEWVVEVRRKAFRRTLVMQLKADGRIVMKGGLLTTRELMVAFLNSRLEWIRGHMRAYAEQTSRLPSRRLTNDGTYPFLGVGHRLRAVPTPLKIIFVSRSEGELLVHLPKEIFQPGMTDLSMAHTALREFYRTAGEKYLSSRVEHWARETGLRPSALRFRDTRTRWGSCNSKGRISLNWRLMVYRPEIVDGVVVHELCHLEHMDHSANFWGLLEKIQPDARALSREIRRDHRRTEFLDEIRF